MTEEQVKNLLTQLKLKTEVKTVEIEDYKLDEFGGYEELRYPTKVTVKTSLFFNDELISKSESSDVHLIFMKKKKKKKKKSNDYWEYIEHEGDIEPDF